MDEFTIRVLCLVAGLVLGWALGLLHSTNRYAKRTRDNTEYCRAVLQRKIDREGSVPLPPHTGDAAAVAQAPEYSTGEVTLPPRDDRGAVNLTTVGMVIALAVVIFSLGSTLHTNARVAATQHDLLVQGQQRDRENDCTSNVLFSTVNALNERSTYTTAQATANIALQQAQLKFLTSISQGDTSPVPLNNYVAALTNYTKVTSKQKDTTESNPFPKQSDYSACLAAARKGS